MTEATRLVLQCPACLELKIDPPGSKGFVRHYCEKCKRSFVPHDVMLFPTVGIQPEKSLYELEDCTIEWNSELNGWFLKYIGEWLGEGGPCTEPCYTGPYETLRAATSEATAFKLLIDEVHWLGAPRARVVTLLSEESWLRQYASRELVKAFADGERTLRPMAHCAMEIIARDRAEHRATGWKLHQQGWSWRDRSDPSLDAQALRVILERRVIELQIPEALEVQVSPVQRVRRRHLENGAEVAGEAFTGVVVTIQSPAFGVGAKLEAVFSAEEDT
jgi:hypothetical protein